MSSQEDKEQIKQLVEQIINNAISVVPTYLEEIDQNNETFKVKDPQEFVYGIVMGLAMGMMGGALLTTQKEAPSSEDQIMIRDMIYKHIPDIRERIFS